MKVQDRQLHKAYFINETEIIINDLLNKAIEDFTKESEILLKKYLSDYLK